MTVAELRRRSRLNGRGELALVRRAGKELGLIVQIVELMRMQVMKRLTIYTFRCVRWMIVVDVRLVDRMMSVMVMLVERWSMIGLLLRERRRLIFLVQVVGRLNLIVRHRVGGREVAGGQVTIHTVQRVTGVFALTCLVIRRYLISDLIFVLLFFGGRAGRRFSVMIYQFDIFGIVRIHFERLAVRQSDSEPRRLIGEVDEQLAERC